MQKIRNFPLSETTNNVGHIFTAEEEKARDGKSVRNSTDANFQTTKMAQKRLIRDILQFTAKQRKIPGKELWYYVFIYKPIRLLLICIIAYEFLTRLYTSEAEFFLIPVCFYTMHIMRRMAKRAHAV